MPSPKPNDNPTFQQKVRTLQRLYASGCKTEKDLQSITMGTALAIPKITVLDLQIITALQIQTKDHTLFSYLGSDFEGGAMSDPDG